METMKDWGNWKKVLGKTADMGETVGMSEETIAKAAEKVGTFFSNNVDPRNDEERLLKELWDAADEKDRQTLAKLVVKISDK